MNSRQKYKGRFIDPRVYELRDVPGWTAEFSIEEHDGIGVTETMFFLPGTFLSKQSAIDAAIQSGQHKIDTGFRAMQ